MNTLFRIHFAPLMVLLLCIAAAQSVVIPPPPVATFDKTVGNTIPDLNQNRDFTGDGVPETKWCAPTASADCVWYFGKKAYPNLIPPGANDTAKADAMISALGNMMGTNDAAGGTTIMGCVNGLQNYYNGPYPGTFNVGLFTAWTFPDDTGQPSAVNLWNFMTTALQNCDDVLPIIKYGPGAVPPTSESDIYDLPLDSQSGHLLMMIAYNLNLNPDTITNYDPDDDPTGAHAFPMGIPAPVPVTSTVRPVGFSPQGTALTLAPAGIAPPYIVGAIISTAVQQPPQLEFGDAPEGGIAYPSLGVFGQFPTCMTVGPAGWIQHTNFGAYFGPLVDFETDGNAGACGTAACFPPYDLDECFQDGDAGLMFPEAFTIDNAMNVVTCSGNPGTSLGQTCTTAVWGTNIDIKVTNTMPNQTIGYVNVLCDWDMDGKWSGASQCPTAAAPEWVLVNFPVPNPYNGPLSNLMAAGSGFLIGPRPGHVWVRFTITERPITMTDWDGNGNFEDGETEDYLLQVDPYIPPQDLDFGDAPDNPAALGYPTLLINNGARHVINGIDWLGDATDSPDPEADGQPTANANGDDLDANGDDEDGVQIPVMIQGVPANVTFQVSSTDGAGGWVDGWIDFNNNMNWGDPGEQIVSANYADGVYTMPVVAPAGGFAGTTYARFRITRDQLAINNPAGLAKDGEVEDYTVTIEEQPPYEFDFGDAPEGGSAYPKNGLPNIIGQFPTCMMAGPAGWIQHTIIPGVGAWFGPAVDPEPDGNAGLCMMPPCFPPYDQDECFADGDAGLLFPDSYTIDGTLKVTQCVSTTPGAYIGRPCTNAAWGANMDIHINNFMPTGGPAFVNVLADWDRNGFWNGAGVCTGGILVPEHILVDFPVPPGFAGPLSALMPPGFTIGPKSGFVWVRFSITERPVGTSDWDGSGFFEDGETEDYLLRVFPTCVDYNVTKTIAGMADNLVNVNDINQLINYVNINKVNPLLWVVLPANPAWDARYDFTSDNRVNVNDLNAMINFVNTNRPNPALFVVNCVTCGC
jgi:hypothetical protein